MSLNEMARLENSGGLSKNDAEWWPKWMEACDRPVNQLDALGGPACFKLGAQHEKSRTYIESENDVVPV